MQLQRTWQGLQKDFAPWSGAQRREESCHLQLVWAQRQRWQGHAKPPATIGNSSAPTEGAHSQNNDNTAFLTGSVLSGPNVTLYMCGFIQITNTVTFAPPAFHPLTGIKNTRAPILEMASADVVISISGCLLFAVEQSTRTTEKNWPNMYFMAKIQQANNIKARKSCSDLQSITQWQKHTGGLLQQAVMHLVMTKYCLVLPFLVNTYFSNKVSQLHKTVLV